MIENLLLAYIHFYAALLISGCELIERKEFTRILKGIILSPYFFLWRMTSDFYLDFNAICWQDTIQSNMININVISVYQILIHVIKAYNYVLRQNISLFKINMPFYFPNSFYFPFWICVFLKTPLNDVHLHEIKVVFIIVF